MKYEAWSSYKGSSALILAAVLLAVAAVLAWLGTRLRGRIGAEPTRETCNIDHCDCLPALGILFPNGSEGLRA